MARWACASTIVALRMLRVRTYACPLLRVDSTFDELKDANSTPVSSLRLAFAEFKHVKKKSIIHYFRHIIIV
jgi:hypothetical protein